jgi:hypothetical protein
MVEREKGEPFVVSANLKAIRELTLMDSAWGVGQRESVGA